MSGWNWSSITSKLLDAAETASKALVENIAPITTSSATSSDDEDESPHPPTTSLPPHSKEKAKEDEESVGITPKVIEFVENICNHPNTFKDFPTDNLVGNHIKLTPKQEKHAMLILKYVPELSQLRYKLCPVHMKDETFWCIYFLLVYNKTGNIFTDIVVPPPPPTDDNNNNNNNNNNNDNEDIIDITTTTSTEQQHDRKTTTTTTIDSTPTKQQKITSTTHTHTPVTPLEDYFDKLYTSQMAEHSNLAAVDDGVEPDEDNYFSPLKYKYRNSPTITNSPIRYHNDTMTDTPPEDNCNNSTSSDNNNITTYNDDGRKDDAPDVNSEN